MILAIIHMKFSKIQPISLGQRHPVKMSSEYINIIIETL